MKAKKSVLVTGASSGLGHAIAKELAQKQYVVFAGVRREADKSLFNDPLIIPVILDVTKRQDIESVNTFLGKSTNGDGLFCLINNAGINSISPFELTEEEDERRIFDVNLFGAMALTRKIFPLLHRYVQAAGKRAKIINVSSIGGIFGLPWEASYHASKFAMLGLSQSIRYELEALDIDVCCFLPGGMQTKIFEKSILKNQNQTSSHQYSNYYFENVDHMNDVMKRFEKSAAPPEQAAKAIRKLLEKEKMPLKSFFGTDAKFINLLSWLGLTGLLKGQFIKDVKQKTDFQR